jgi:hypothetical protein
VLFFPVTIWSTEEHFKKGNRDTKQHRSKDSWYLNQTCVAWLNAH